MPHECKKEEVIDMIYHDQKEMKRDIKKLLEFQHTTQGKFLLISILYSSAIVLLSKFLWRS